MKYMGSKAGLLKGRLGDTLLQEAALGERFVDLFAGSGAVSHFVAENVFAPVVSVDFQTFSASLALAITGRDEAVDADLLLTEWLKPARENFDADSLLEKATRASRHPSRTSVTEARRLCRREGTGTVWGAYGGYYFSPVQALALDHLMCTAPSDNRIDLARACLIRAASKAAAAPGHTAQPFQPTPKLLPYIETAWKRDVFAETAAKIRSLSSRHAKTPGSAVVGDANLFALDLSSSDVVFCDPPYSAAQYSRFYHVLEGISLGGWPSVSGQGRAPSRKLRSTSNFSLKRNSRSALTELFSAFRTSRCTVVMTFPSGEASNGLSGKVVRLAALESFRVESFAIPHVHSTLGGPALDSVEGGVRGPRRLLEELVLVLRPI